MKMRQIRDSVAVWQRVAKLAKAPALALVLIRYYKKLAAELQLLNEMNDNLIYECAGVEKPTPPDVTIVQIPEMIEAPGEEGEEPKKVANPQNIAFWEKFNKVLDSDSELFPLDMTLDQFVEELSKFPDNAISEDDLEMLEPFFKQ